jgi:hypothetical protein
MVYAAGARRIRKKKNVYTGIEMVLVDSCWAADGTLSPMGIELLRYTKSRWEDNGWTGGNRVLRRYFGNERFEARCEGYWLTGSVKLKE